mgnify:CR=1 FL=1
MELTKSTVATVKQTTINFTPEEKSKMKRALLFCIKKKAKASGNHCGFHLHDLRPVLEEMANEGQIISRDTIKDKRYFLKLNQ